MIPDRQHDSLDMRVHRRALSCPLQIMRCVLCLRIPSRTRNYYLNLPLNILQTGKHGSEVQLPHMYIFVHNGTSRCPVWLDGPQLSREAGSVGAIGKVQSIATSIRSDKH